MYQPAYKPDGSRWHDGYNEIHYFDDACWDRFVPDKCRHLTYLDVGCQCGLYPLRFWQRGGVAIGLDVDDSGRILDAAAHSKAGVELGLHIADFKDLRAAYDAQYYGYVGGFSEIGNIIPPVLKFDIVSCMNVLEYMVDPNACIQSLLNATTGRLLITTDVTLDQPTRNPNLPNFQVQKWLFNLDELVGVIGGGVVHTIPNAGIEGWHQAFIAYDVPNSSLGQAPSQQIFYGQDMTETQRQYIGGKSPEILTVVLEKA